MQGVHEWFASKGIVGSLRHNDLNPLSGRITYSGTKALAVANLLYAQCQPLHLKRKQAKYREMVTALDRSRGSKRATTLPHIDHGLSILSSLPNAT
jgi:hypothetical protein